MHAGHGGIENGLDAPAPTPDAGPVFEEKPEPRPLLSSLDAFEGDQRPHHAEAHLVVEPVGPDADS